MDEQEWMRRVDRHLDNVERGNETLKDYMRDGHELMARIDATIERNTEAFLGLRAYLDGATRMLTKMAAEIGADREERTRARQEQRELWQEWREERKDWREESRAHREALAARPDRLRNEPPPATA